MKKAVFMAVLTILIGTAVGASSAVKAQDRDDRWERDQRGYDRDYGRDSAGQRDRDWDRDRDRDRDRGRDRGRYDRGGYGERVAEQRGYATGLDRGRDDARNRRSFNPNNSSHYRDGDSGYRSEYGSREAYRQAYRAAFRRGYEVGYRENSRFRRRF
jgi:opacity protein-like surface antigen